MTCWEETSDGDWGQLVIAPGVVQLTGSALAVAGTSKVLQSPVFEATACGEGASVGTAMASVPLRA